MTRELKWKLPLYCTKEGRHGETEKNNMETVLEQVNGEMTVASTNYVGTTGQPYAKNKVVPLLHIIYKT